MTDKKLSYGPDLVHRLLPHSRPFLMVDRIYQYSSHPKPALLTSKYLSANEPMFDGHFPQLSLMPGAMTLEGMGQTAHLLFFFRSCLEEFTQNGRSGSDLWPELDNLQLAYSLGPGHNRKRAEIFSNVLDKHVNQKLGVVGSANLKFLEPVFAGCRIDYCAILTGAFGELVQFEVSAEVDGVVKAKGKLAVRVFTRGEK